MTAACRACGEATPTRRNGLPRRESPSPARLLRSPLLRFGAAASAVLSIGAAVSDPVELHPTLLDVLWRAVHQVFLS